MPASATVDALYEQQIKPLSQADQLRLLALLAQDAVAIVQHVQAEAGKMTLTERLARANYSGGRLFKTGEERKGGR